MDTSKAFLQSIMTRFGGIHTEASVTFFGCTGILNVVPWRGVCLQTDSWGWWSLPTFWSVSELSYEAWEKPEILSRGKSSPSSYSFLDVIQENTKKPQQYQLATCVSFYMCHWGWYQWVCFNPQAFIGSEFQTEHCSRYCEEIHRNGHGPCPHEAYNLERKILSLQDT